jgi:hypothetical protein
VAGRVIRLDVEHASSPRYKAGRWRVGNSKLRQSATVTRQEDLNLGRLLALALLILVLGGVVFLAIWEIPPPTAPVETVIPDEQLPR